MEYEGIFILLIIIGLVVDFIPTMVAFSRGHKNAGLLFFLNLLFGWTVIVWIILLIWAVSGRTRDEHEYIQRTIAKK